MNNFSNLGLSAPILKALDDLGFEQPSEIQQKAIPILTQSTVDFIGLAQTGTGKTAAFGLPLIGTIDTSKKVTQALILAPTRELGQQIAGQLELFAKYMPALRTQVVYGGAPIDRQIKALKNTPHIIVATPGRLMDLMKRKCINLNNTQTLVLDEADEMLNMGFKEAIDEILQFLPKEKSTWLFSATMAGDIRRIVKQYMHNPQEVSVSKSNSVNKNIEHFVAQVHRNDKTDYIARIIESTNDIVGVVFCRTKMDTQKLADDLVKKGHAVEAIHGDLNQNQRDRVMEKFKSHKVKMITATDVAARGIDVNNLTHVIHHSLPDDIEYYTHRSGRTGRAGKQGESIVLVSRNEQGKIKQLEKRLDIRFSQYQLPDIMETAWTRLQTWSEELRNVELDPEIPYDLTAAAELLFVDMEKEELVKKLIQFELNRSGLDLKPKKQEKRRNDDNGSSRDRSSTRDRGERGDRDRSSRRKSASQRISKFSINVGKMDKVSKGDLVNFICDYSGISKREVGKIELQKKHSFFEVDSKKSKQVTQAFNDIFINGRELQVSEI